MADCRIAIVGDLPVRHVVVPSLAAVILLHSACGGGAPPPLPAPTAGSSATDWLTERVVSEQGAGDAGVDGATHGESAASHLEAGEAALKRSDLSAAEREFRLVIDRYPYSKRAMVAEIRLGDLAEARGDKEKAARIYRQWLISHQKSLDLEQEVRSKLDEVEKVPGGK
jgi:hypothetical protein